MKLDKSVILDILRSHKYEIKKYYNVTILGLFGSFSKNQEHKDSDIDILYEIEKDKTMSAFKLLKLISYLEDLLGKKVDLVRDDVIKPKLKNIIHRELINV